MLLYCNRSGVSQLSSTDLECTWKKKDGKTVYDKQVPVVEYCHVDPVPEVFLLSDPEKQEITVLLMAAAPESALTKHSKRRRTDPLASHQDCSGERASPQSL